MSPNRSPPPLPPPRFSGATDLAPLVCIFLSSPLLLSTCYIFIQKCFFFTLYYFFLLVLVLTFLSAPFPAPLIRLFLGSSLFVLISFLFVIQLAKRDARSRESSFNCYFYLFYFFSRERKRARRIADTERTADAMPQPVNFSSGGRRDV